MTKLSWFEIYDDEHYGYDMTTLQIDEAYLNPRSSDNTKFFIYKTHKECIQCPYFKLNHVNGEPLILSNVPQYIYRISTEDEEMLLDANSSNILCDIKYDFGEFGIYNLDVTRKRCVVETIVEPVSIYFPILTVVLIYLGLFFILLSTRIAWNKYIDKSTKQNANEIENKKKRVRSLDTFRGISIVIMIFVNFGAGKYNIIEHAVWNGLHIADLVFPWFMWIMGVCIPISLMSNFNKQIPINVMCKNIFWRSLKLFCLGIFLGSSINLDYLRIFGVLQRFGICYFIVTILCVLFMNKNIDSLPQTKYKKLIGDLLTLQWIWLFVAGIFIIHTIILFQIADTGCPRGYLGPGGWHKDEKYENCTGGATGFIDRLILGNHAYNNPTIKEIYNSQAFDPEGILGILTSVVQVFFGVQAGTILLLYKKHSERLTRWLIWAVVYGVIGGVLCGFTKNDGLIPINKNIWSISFVLVTCSFAFTLLSLCYILVDIKQWWSGKPFLFAGMNSIILYVGHSMTYDNFPVRWNLHAGKPHSTHFIALLENVWGTIFWVLVSYYLFKINYFFSL